ncbi:antitoxin component YwqK of YwqJK toxin-antitoxin module [Flavobacterium sp. PL11]|jgi:antitoxin component YwqK of YwqJK toxin-antitoxin module|uniref:toxin-antitoxin system YwqK family antitoxin n=1 Tax=Flavobacterium sp. PL11 TaxID=3071717 RepID=UPI002DF7B94C|nr:antitoxin component YwqK of YwqJK toxin-antitoxin module [Flavobacterium sp. PL11]
MKVKNKRIAILYVTLMLLISTGFSNAQTNINQFDEQGKKHGLWVGFYNESKRPKYEGAFEHGKESGLFKFYDDTKAKSLIATREFNAKDNSAYTIFYDQKGNKVSEGKVVNKLFEGEWKYYHQAAKSVMTLEHYKIGKLEGVQTTFYQSGKVAEEIVYKNNLKNGVYKKYTENGTILEESNFVKDNYQGTAVFRDANGEVVSKGVFTNGQKTGIWQFYDKGALVKEVNMSISQNEIKTKK